MTRAERFEEEKRRIIESCFFKTDEGGSCMCMAYVDQVGTDKEKQYPNPTLRTSE